MIESDIAASKSDAVGLKRAAIEVGKSIALAPDQAMGYVARADLRISFDWDWIGARADIDKARALEPSYPGVLPVSAYLLSTLGRLPEAIAELRKSLDSDPLAVGSLERLGLLYAATGDFAASDAALNRALELEPLARIPLFIFGIRKLLQGDGLEALAAFRKIDDEGFRLTGIAQAQHTLGNAAESQRALGELIEKYSTADPYQIAETYAWREEPDKAFEWLERSYRQRDSGLADIKGDPLIASIRADPRYKALLRKMNLPE